MKLFNKIALLFITVFGLLTVLLWSPYAYTFITATHAKEILSYFSHPFINIQTALRIILVIVSATAMGIGKSIIDHNPLWLRKIKSIFPLPLDVWVIIVSVCISLAACVFFYNLGLHLSGSDGLSRLNIARKVVDNLTPGLGQFGSVWPFLPQLLMVPFVAITPLWSTGIAGMLLSAPCFVVASYFFYKILMDITKNKFVSFIGLIIFGTNINLLLLQTMAMSETLFLACILGAMYFLLVWIKNPTKLLLPLIFAGVCLAGASLSRYEGIAFTFATIAVVCLILILKRYSLKTIEGVTLFFSTVALFGLFLWCLYNATIFNDPLYWAKIYLGQNAVISTLATRDAAPGGALDTTTAKYLAKVSSYLLAIAEMSGIPMYVLGLGGLFAYILSFRPWKDHKNFIVLLPLSIVAFMFVTFYKSGLPIFSPEFSLGTMWNFSLTYASEYNVRYGLLLWPLIVLMTMWLVSKAKLSRIFAIVVLVIALGTPLYHRAFLMYQLPFGWGVNVSSDPKVQAAQWMKANYTGGLIMMSALKQDPIMFKLGLPYKTYIHEGTGKYWLVAREHPEKEAEWIFMTDKKTPGSGESDPVSEYLEGSPILTKFYEERYNDGVIDIFEKRKTPLTDAQIKNPALPVKPVFTGRLVDENGRPVTGVLLFANEQQSINKSDGTFTIPVSLQKTKITFIKPGMQLLTYTMDFSQADLSKHTIIMRSIKKPTLLQTVMTYL